MRLCPAICSIGVDSAVPNGYGHLKGLRGVVGPKSDAMSWKNVLPEMVSLQDASHVTRFPSAKRVVKVSH